MDNQNQPLDADMDPAGENPQELIITENIRQYWTESRKWGLFFAVLGFIYLGFLLLSVLGISSMGNGGIFAGVFMLLIAGGLIFVPVWLIFQFSQNLKKGLETESIEALGLSFTSLRRLYQFAGILMIVILAFYAIMFLFMLTFMAGRGGM
ncbi:MAG: hypothetical protein H6574_05270 [Lewinellaceae bacterium]|nr:hypothetical protein [Saprospiraceae bacterium]MCB9316539.1 hypothetical protein [Lewinellaceae bacterium]MCB9330473.1 hypothetical protein [Lewinellaceae bacterium]